MLYLGILHKVHWGAFNLSNKLSPLINQEIMYNVMHDINIVYTSLPPSIIMIRVISIEFRCHCGILCIQRLVQLIRTESPLLMVVATAWRVQLTVLSLLQTVLYVSVSMVTTDISWKTPLCPAQVCETFSSLDRDHFPLSPALNLFNPSQSSSILLLSLFILSPLLSPSLHRAALCLS